MSDQRYLFHNPAYPVYNAYSEKPVAQIQGGFM